MNAAQVHRIVINCSKVNPCTLLTRITWCLPENTFFIKEPFISIFYYLVFQMGWQKKDSYLHFAFCFRLRFTIQIRRLKSLHVVPLNSPVVLLCGQFRCSSVMFHLSDASCNCSTLQAESQAPNGFSILMERSKKLQSVPRITIKQCKKPTF